MVKHKKTTKTIRPSAKLGYTRFKHLVHSRRFGHSYLFLSLGILLATTVFWSLLAAHVHQSNADQLVNPYMFESHSTFHNAVFPGQHSNLLKWPIFWMIHIFGQSTSSYMLATVIISVATISIFARILYSIEKRPIIFGTLLLALASVLLLTPAQPYPGGLLPINMGMITSRNLEYVLYIGSLLAIVRTIRIRSYRFYLGCVGLLILIASDKLFLTISIIGAIVASICYIVLGKRQIIKTSLNWLLASLIASIGSVALLLAISASGISHISTQSSGPYNLIHSVHQFGLGIFYAMTGIFTNFGANPSFNTTYVSQMPSRAIDNLFSPIGPTLIINVTVLIFTLVCVLSIVLHSFGRQKIAGIKTDASYRLSVLLSWTTVAAIGAFIFSDHYYAGDARYLSIILFASFISAACILRTKKFREHIVVITGMIILASLILSIPSVRQYAHQEDHASQQILKRNYLIAQAVFSHPVNVLVGDYWRVIPIRQISNDPIRVMPLGGCTQPNGVLTSSTWQPNLGENSFAYILSLDKSLTNFPHCTLNDAITAYGKPNASIVIAGSLDNPSEMLLFYDHGAHKSSPSVSTAAAANSTTMPLLLSALPNTSCLGKTTLNIIAHQDDDLLFMNPNISTQITEGNCIRTVYLTAGDAGGSSFYWLSREQGSEAAYSRMIGTDAIWIQRTVKLGENQFITVANPKGNNKISLIFMRLPDGNLRGNGFKRSFYQSLRKLYDGEISYINSVYGGSIFTKDNLISDLTAFMNTYQPSIVNTQSGKQSKTKFQDHSDHMSTSDFTDLAYSQYASSRSEKAQDTEIFHFMGYPVRGLPENLDSAQLSGKIGIFLQYALYDGAVCQTYDKCNRLQTYGIYLRRQYLEQ